MGKKIRVEICCGLHCSMKGGQELFDMAESDELIKYKKFNITPVNCIQKCCQGGILSPVVAINGKIYTEMTAARLISTLRNFLN